MVKALGADNVVTTEEILACVLGVLRVESIGQNLTMSHWTSLAKGVT